MTRFLVLCADGVDRLAETFPTEQEAREARTRRHVCPFNPHTYPRSVQFTPPARSRWPVSPPDQQRERETAGGAGGTVELRGLATTQASAPVPPTLEGVRR